MPGLFAGLRINTRDEEDVDAWEDDAMSMHQHHSVSTLTSTNYSAHSSVRTDLTLDFDMKIDVGSPIAEVEGDLPATGRHPRKPVPSMHEYMSLDQLEDMWGKQDQLGGGFFGGFDMMPVALADDGNVGHPF